MATKIMKIHPLCRKFGQVAPLSKGERAEMAADIKANGIKVPILVNGKGDTILDGATRWQIAYELKLKLAPDRFEKFESEDEADIKKEIMSRNLFRRHMSDDQRVAMVSELMGPDLEAAAKERQSKAGTFKGKTKLNGKGSAAEEIAKTSGSTKYKAKQAEKVRKTVGLEGVVQGKEKLASAAKRAGSKKRKTKVVDFKDQVYKKWTQWLNRFPQPVRRQVVELVVGWAGPKVAAK